MYVVFHCYGLTEQGRLYAAFGVTLVAEQLAIDDDAAVCLNICARYVVGEHSRGFFKWHQLLQGKG